MKKFSMVSLTVLTGVVLGLACVSNAGAQDAKKPAPARKPNPAFEEVKDDPKLPRVLIIGDSISIGYTADVRKMLEGEANVHRIPTNGGPTTRGLESLDAWLGDGKWDVIHFNWGLHDLKYMGANDSNLADPKAEGSHQQVPPKDYEANLRSLVTRLKATGAKLIWCSTTPVPEGAAGRIKGDSVAYNKIAAKIMSDEHVATDDLYTRAMAKLEEVQLPANVHYKPEGYKYLAEQVARSIRVQLKH